MTIELDKKDLEQVTGGACNGLSQKKKVECLTNYYEKNKKEISKLKTHIKEHKCPSCQCQPCQCQSCPPCSNNGPTFHTHAEYKDVKWTGGGFGGQY